MDNRRNWAIAAGVGCLLVALFAAAVLVLGSLAISRSVRMPVNGAEEVDEPVGLEERVVEEEVFEAEPVQPAGGDLTALYEAVNPGVVNIATTVVRGGQIGGGAGSGFIFDEDGYIATNHHVVTGAEQVIVVFYDGLEVEAEVVGSDPASDLAVLRVENLSPGAVALPLGDSDEVRVGQQVVAIGNPFTLGSTMTAGIISATGRAIPSGFTPFNIPEAIQTDAPINPGNSGGPLISLNGEVIGINAQIQASPGVTGNVGIGFAIPSNILRQVAPALIERGSYQWPWLGVSGNSVNLAIAQAMDLETQSGAYIVTVVEGGPADEAGLQGATGQEEVNGIPVPVGGDIVIAAGEDEIRDWEDLLDVVAFNQPGETVVLTVIRDGETLEVPVELEARPEDEPAIPNPFEE